MYRFILFLQAAHSFYMAEAYNQGIMCRLNGTQYLLVTLRISGKISNLS